VVAALAAETLSGIALTVAWNHAGVAIHDVSFHEVSPPVEYAIKLASGARRVCRKNLIFIHTQIQTFFYKYQYVYYGNPE
jgi:hypothetical protein